MDRRSTRADAAALRRVEGALDAARRAGPPRYGALREALGWSAASDERPTKTYEDFGYKPLDETAEPLDPTARAMQDYVQDADRPTYLDGN